MGLRREGRWPRDRGGGRPRDGIPLPIQWDVERCTSRDITAVSPVVLCGRWSSVLDFIAFGRKTYYHLVRVVIKLQGA